MIRPPPEADLLVGEAAGAARVTVEHQVALILMEKICRNKKACNEGPIAMKLAL